MHNTVPEISRSDVAFETYDDVSGVVVLWSGKTPHDTLRSMLAPEESAALESIVEEKRAEWLLARVAAKQVITECVYRTRGYALAEQSIIVRRGHNGAPFCILNLDASGQATPSGEFHISLAHTNGCAAAVVALKHSYAGIGLDIELVRPFREETVRAFLTEREFEKYRSLSSVAEVNEFLTLYWCTKEAYLKAIGTGIRTHPSRVELHRTENSTHFELYVDHVPVCAQVSWTLVGGLYMLVIVRLC